MPADTDHSRWSPPSRWGTYYSNPRAEMQARRQDWLAEMAEKFGIVPAEHTVYGLSTLVKVLMPDVFGSTTTFNTYRPIGRGEAAYENLEQRDLFHRKNCHEFRVLIHWAGIKTSKQKVACDILVDRRGRGSHKAKWVDRNHAKRAVLYRLPQGSEIMW